MLVVDYTGVAMSAIVLDKAEPDENILRHMILNTLRMFNHRHREEFGEMIIAADSHSWRRDYFPQYKHKRRQSRDKDTRDWTEIFRIISLIKDEIAENLPYRVIHEYGAEADDIIGVLAQETQEFGKDEPVLILSADKDMAQLQRFKNVKQYSPMMKKWIRIDDPARYLFEHIVKGDAGDGIPNILSPDDVFVTEGTRQSPVTKKKIEEWYRNPPTEGELYRNFIRNKKLIDLSETPEEIRQRILESYHSQNPKRKAQKVMPYLMKKRCKLLMESIQDFFPPTQ